MLVCVAIMSNLYDQKSDSLHKHQSGSFMEIEQEIIGTFFEQMSSAAYIKDEDLKFVYVNSVYADFCGMAAERFIGKSSFEIVKSVATKLLEQDEAKVLATGVATQVSDRATSYRGAMMWREVERRPIICKSGARYLAVTLRDISKHKEIEFKLKDKEKELAETRDLAETTEHRSADFLAKVSHQVSTPLQSIISMASSVSDQDFDKDRKTFSDLIVSSGRAALGILDDIPSHSSLDIMKVPVKSELFELFKLVGDITTFVMPDAHKKNLQFSTYIDPEIPMLLSGDAGKIRQILINLINNAIDFTDNGEINVNIHFVPDDDERLAIVRFEVQDTGFGISPQKQERLFDKYGPVNAGEQSGLGLSISSALVSLMGGKIGLDSNVGNGSKFWFELGLDIPKKLTRPIQKALDLKKKRFIVIDNNEFDRALLEHQLSEWGGDVAACSNSDEAIAVMCALFEKGMTVEGIFIDDQTNQTNDIDLHALMRDDEVLSHIPLFMMVASGDNLKVRARLANEYIVKPLDMISLRSIVARAYAENSEELIIDEDIAEITELPAKHTARGSDQGFQTLIGNDSEQSKIDILIFESNTVNQIMLAQIMETTGYKFKIISDLSEGETLFKSCCPKIVIIDATNREFNNEDTKLNLEKLKRFNGLVPLLGMTALQNTIDAQPEANVLLPVFDGQITKPVSPPELFNTIEKWMRIADGNKAQTA